MDRQHNTRMVDYYHSHQSEKGYFISVVSRTRIGPVAVVLTVPQRATVQRLTTTLKYNGVPTQDERCPMASRKAYI